MPRSAGALANPTSPPLALSRLPPLELREQVTAEDLAAAIRGLALGSVPPDRPGRAALPVAMAEAAGVLFSRFHKFDAADPRWPDRDRFVLSAGHGELLLYVLLHLTGHAGMGLDELRAFRQPDFSAPGTPVLGRHPAIETTSGPLGQGFASAVGMALAERVLAARFGRSLVDHRTWVVASDGDLMEGVSHEAASIAGQLRLSRLTVLWDDGAAQSAVCEPPEGEDTLRRFAAYGWAVRRVDGHAPTDMASALSMAVRSPKPTLIACRTGPGAHDATRPTGGPVPELTATVWAEIGRRGSGPRRAWLKRLARHPLRTEFERVTSGRLPEAAVEALAALRSSLAASRPALAPRAASRLVLEAVAPVMPELVGGAADLAGSGGLLAKGMASATAGHFSGRHIRWGMREHGMAAAMNGMAVHGGLLPYGSTGVVFTDHMRPALRLAAMMRQRVIAVLTQDGGDRSEDGGEDGPTHQPLEHLASLRALPNLLVFRPADAIETAECWELAFRRADGPSALVLSRLASPALRPPGSSTENRSARGGYVLAEAEGARQVTLIATGPEVATAMAARDALRAEGCRVAVVSLPCWDLFARADEATRAAVLGSAPRIGIEAADPFGWDRWLGPDGIFVGFDNFASHPGKVLARPGAADVVAAARHLINGRMPNV